MSVEIVFTGLCSFLNPYNSDDHKLDMPLPSVIVPRTDLNITLPHVDEEGKVHNNLSQQIGDKRHIPFLAFDSKMVLVDDARGFKRARGHHENFWYRELDGYLLQIQDLEDSPLIVDKSFKQYVASKDKYWPDAQNKWNPAFVPKRGDRPKKAAVHAYIPFKGGILSAGRLSTVQWMFPVSGDDVPYCGYFAEEVVYSNFLASNKDVLWITVLDLHSLKEVATLRFKARQDRPESPKDFCIFIGNSTEDGMHFHREPDFEDRPPHGKHIAYLNQVADPQIFVPAPIPVPIPKSRLLASDEEGKSGGSSAGFCGPGSANG